MKKNSISSTIVAQSQFMQSPISYRRGIPFFYDKTSADFQKDIYERYDSMVVRQSALHLADDLWQGYPMQAILDFASPHYSTTQLHDIVEVGCGVGRWIATLAQNHLQTKCWGIDYSYQMLKRANEFWIQGKEITIDLSHKGFLSPITKKGVQLPNLKLGLAKADKLPFASNSQDLVLSSFLFDRLDAPIEALLEMQRILRPSGKIIIITPLNFNQTTHWQNLYPSHKIHQLLVQMKFRILEWQDNLHIKEPLDARGNTITWNCLGFVIAK